MSARAYQRIPYVVEVEFRTASSFLVAYSINLSRGGMFLETDHDIEVGEPITLRFAVPGCGPVEARGEVVWRRNEPTGPSDPPRGLGVQFQDMSRDIGNIIDQLVREYEAVRVLIVAGSDQEASALTRMTRAVLSTAKVENAFDASAAAAALDSAMDAAVIVTDEPFALEVLGMAKDRKRPIPVVALTNTRQAKEQVSAMGADEVVDNPPSFIDFQSAMVRALGRPMNVRESPPDE